MNRPTRYYSNKQEKKIAKQTGGRQQSNSGATAFQKGDVITEYFLIEAKTTTSERKSFTIQKEWLDKNKEEAFAMHKQCSALAFDFGDGEQHYVIDERLFKILMDAVEKLNE